MTLLKYSLFQILKYSVEETTRRATICAGSLSLALRWVRDHEGTNRNRWRLRFDEQTSVA